MLRKSIIAMSLCGMMWSVTSQAGFFGNNQDLQFLRDINSSANTVSGATGGDKVTPDKPQYKPTDVQNTPGDLSIVALNGGDTQYADAPLAATVPEPGAFYLVALGLAILGGRAYLRQRVPKCRRSPPLDLH
jgi:hypothetical protein